MNREEIIELCDKYNLTNYTIRGDGLVDVNGKVDISYFELTSLLPLRFGKVSGDFTCRFNHLITLEGCPVEVGGDFHCYDNKLTTLEYCPSIIGGDFTCSHNQLTSLEFSPKVVGGNFFCCGNNLTTLEGCTNRVGVGGDFDCGRNNLSVVSYIHLFELGFDMDNIKCDIDLTPVKRMWIINGILND